MQVFVVTIFRTPSPSEMNDLDSDTLPSCEFVFLSLFNDAVDSLCKADNIAFSRLGSGSGAPQHIFPLV
jgi:hypothetical protein